MAAELQALVLDYLSKHPDLGTFSRELGSGNFGTAYLTSKNLVVKLTSDKPEFDCAKEIAQKANGKYSPKFFALDPVGKGLFIIVMEFVKPLSLTAQESAMLNQFRDRLTTMLEDGENILPIKKSLSRLGSAKLEQVLGGLIDCMAGLHSIGILDDDIHEDNMGIVNGRLVLFDIVKGGGVLAEQRATRALDSLQRLLETWLAK